MMHNYIPDKTWNLSFQELEKSPTYVSRDELTPVQRQHAERVLTLWNLSLHWVIKKKWYEGYKIPYERKVAKILEPFGRLIYHHLELCIQCHSFLPYPNPYTDASEWFNKFVREAQYNSIFDPSDLGKTDNIEARRKLINDIENGTNSVSKNCPHNYQLIDACLHLVKSDVFDKEYFQPYLRAFRYWNNSTKLPDWQGVVTDIDKVYVRTGQGHGKVPFKLPKSLK